MTTALRRRDAAAAGRALDALNMRKLGYGYEAIAKQCGYTNRGTAYRTVQRELERTIQEPAEELRRIEVERLDDLYRALAPRAVKGDHQAVDRCLRIMERRSSLLGLDAPASVTVNATVNNLGINVILEQMRSDTSLADKSSDFVGLVARLAEARN